MSEKTVVTEPIIPETAYHKVERVLSYEAIRNEIENLPQTWCPALLFAMVRVCVRKKVFAPGGLEKIVARAKAEEEQGK